MSRPAKRAKIDAACLVGTKRLTLSTVRAVLDSLPDDPRGAMPTLGQFRYAMGKAKDLKQYLKRVRAFSRTDDQTDRFECHETCF